MHEKAMNGFVDQMNLKNWPGLGPRKIGVQLLPVVLLILGFKAVILNVYLLTNK